MNEYFNSLLIITIVTVLVPAVMLYRHRKTGMLMGMGYKHIFIAGFLIHFASFVGYLNTTSLFDGLNGAISSEARGLVIVLFLFIPSVALLLFGLNKQIPYMSKLYYEVDRRKKAEKKFKNIVRKLRDARKASNRVSLAKSEFVSNMSHELRTPLNAIIGFSDLIVKEGQAEGQIAGKKSHAKEYARLIESSGRELLTTLNLLLDMTKVELGKLELQYEELDFSNLFEDIVRSHRADATQYGITLECDIEPDVLLMADRRLVKQMLGFVIKNAIQYTKKGGAIRCSVSTDDESGLRILIMDNGIGMSEDEAAHALEPFGKAGQAVNPLPQGPGMGLTLADNYMQLHGGTCDISSTRGVGTDVILRFPPERLISSSDRCNIDARDSAYAGDFI